MFQEYELEISGGLMRIVEFDRDPLDLTLAKYINTFLSSCDNESGK